MDNLIARNTTYSASFTTATGALFHREISAVLNLLKQDDRQYLLIQETRENQFLQINSQITRKKVVAEILSRLEYKFDGYLELFEASQETEQALLLFYLVLKSNALIYDFHFQVTLPSWKGSTRTFDSFSYQMKIDEIGNRNENVREWAESTRKLILKIYKRMLKEAGFLKGNTLIKPVCNSDFFRPFIKNNEIWFLEACFLNQAEREKVLTEYKLKQK